MNDVIAKYQQLLAQAPDNELARFSLGKAYFEAGQHAQAREQLKLAVQAKADWMLAWMLLGKCEIALGLRQEARQTLETALKLAQAQHHQGPMAEATFLLKELNP